MQSRTRLSQTDRLTRRFRMTCLRAPYFFLWSRAGRREKRKKKNNRNESRFLRIRSSTTDHNFSENPSGSARVENKANRKLADEDETHSKRYSSFMMDWFSCSTCPAVLSVRRRRREISNGARIGSRAGYTMNDDGHDATEDGRGVVGVVTHQTRREKEISKWATQ